MRALLLALLIAGSASAQSIEVIPPSGRWVTDEAQLLSPQEEKALGFRLSAYADTTSTQIIVVTLPDLEGAQASEYAVALGRAWAVGQSGVDNGVVVLVSRDDRQVFIATGFGIEGAIPDVIAGRIVRNIIVPQFRQGRFYDGISDAVDALMLAAAGEFDAEDAPAGEGIPLEVIVLLFIVIIIIVLVVSSAQQGGTGGGGTRRRHRSGPVIIWGGGHGGRTGGFGGGGFGGLSGGGGFGGFGGGGGGFGGGGAGGSW